MLNIEAVLTKLNLGYEKVTENIINPYYFSDEPDDEGVNTNIADGGDDMYDDANCLNTNLTQLYADIDNNGADNDTARANSIPYTHTVAVAEGSGDYTDPPMDGIIADGSSYFGAGSQYFTNMYPDMFVMAATGIDIEEFSITGNIGADGDGDYEVNVFTLTSKGRQFTCFNKQVYNSDDPSINHFIFVPGNGSGIVHLYDTDNEHDDHCLQNLTGIDEIYFLLIAKEENEYMNNSERQIIAQAFLDAIVGSQGSRGPTYLNPRITFRAKTYDATTLMGQLPPDGNIENIINQLKNKTVFVPGWPNALKNGDTFTLHGQAASDLKRKLPQINSGGTVLEIFDDSKSIYIFNNADYVDWVVDPGTNVNYSANNIMIFMESIWINYKRFDNISASSWLEVTNNASTIIMPSLGSPLLPDLSNLPREYLRDFVKKGGKLVMFNANDNNISLLNIIFDFSITSYYYTEPFTITAEGAALFDGLNSTIPYYVDTSVIGRGSLPSGSKTIYAGDEVNDQAIVSKIPYSSGSIYVLGWNWNNAAPQGSQDGGWNLLLQKILQA